MQFNDIPDDIMVNKIMSHLFPPDLLNIMKTCTYLGFLIKKELLYIDNICQHIQPHGKLQEYYENGQLHSQGYFKEGKRNGEYKKWYESGTPWIHIHYKKGMLNGEFRTWYNNFQLCVKTNYKEGELHGEYRFWYRNGQLYIETQYKEDELIEPLADWRSGASN